MSVNVGIVGLAKSGKTTIFNALTKGKVVSEKVFPHVGTTKVPDPRLNVLADMLNPKRLIPVEAHYIDVGASTRELDKERGISGQLLAQLSNANAIISVIRSFADETVPHIEGSLDVDRDIATLDLELIFSDMTIIERRLERLTASLKGVKPPERQNLLREQTMLLKLKAELEKGIPIRELTLTDDEVKAITSYQFLSAKPLLIVVNIGEDQINQTALLETELNARYSQPERRVVALCGKLEMELTQLDNDTAEGFRAEFGIRETGLDRIIKASYELLGLVSFFTIVSDEVRAWSVKSGTTAVKASGKIHSDMERGFIRAEVISYGDLVKCGSLAEARKKGLLRLESKNYPVKDGDVITFLFNV